MKGFVLVILLHSASAVLHSLKYFAMASSGLPDFPEFVSVGVIDGVKIVHFDSNERRAKSTQDWMDMVDVHHPNYWKEETENLKSQQHTFKDNIDTVMQRFHQNGGVHVLQRMYGCEWDNRTGDVIAFWQYAYDGEDFIAFNLMTKTWVAAKQQAQTTKLRWESDEISNDQAHHYLSEDCPEWGEKYLNYGNSSLLRTVVPSVFLLQRSPWSPISFMATGFFPNRAALFWTKDGKELHEGVHIGDILPNHDGTFQRRAHLNLSSDEDWHRYKCVFQFSGNKDDLNITLDKAAIKSSSDKGGIIPIILGVFAALLLLGAVSTVFFICRKKQEEEKTSSSNETLMQASVSASISSADSQAPRLYIKVPLMEDADCTVNGADECWPCRNCGSVTGKCHTVPDCLYSCFRVDF